MLVKFYLKAMSNQHLNLKSRFPQLLAAVSLMLILPASLHSTKVGAREDYFCGKNGLNPVQFLRTETRNFNVYICGNHDNPNQYVGIGKRDGKRLVLPLIEESPSGIYMAVNRGGYLYQVTRESLLVFRDGRTIVNEKLTSYQTGS